MDGGTVSNSYYAQDEEIRRASINPISDFQEQADPSKELIERPASLEEVVLSCLSLRTPHVSRSRSDWESLSPSSCETNPPTDVDVELLELGLYKPQLGDNGGEQRILQVDHHSHDCSVISLNSVPLSSRSSSNASSSEAGDSSQAEGWLCFPRLARICLFLNGELCLAALLIRYNTVTSLSEDAKTLLFVAKFLGFAGFLFCFGAFIVQRSLRAARLMAAMGCAATFCGFLTILGTLFPDNLMLLIGALCKMLPISAIAFAV